MKKIILLLTLIVTAAVFSGTIYTIPSMAKEVQKAEAKINVNTATAKELTVLPGIGNKTAANIVSYRQEKGFFKSAQDLLKVPGIGKKTLNKIENLISFE